MIVTQYERLRYKVTSRTGQDPYTVDLMPFSWNGKCDCRDFNINCIAEIRRLKAIGEFKPKEDLLLWTQRTRCAHLRAAWEFAIRTEWAPLIMKQLQAAFPDNNEGEEC